VSRPADGWQDFAFCAFLVARSDVDVTVRLWFPGPGRAERDYAVARRICDQCLVRTECLEYALRTEVEYFRFGMWGGKTADERSKIVRQRQAVTR
jgi:WhiB family redox-sensing transcriptional regulator